MSEYASRESTQSTSYASTTGTSSSSFQPAQRTPAEKSRDAIISAARDVAHLATVIDDLKRATEANDPADWGARKQALDHELTSARKHLDQARQLKGDADSSAKAELAQAETTFAKHAEAAAAFKEPPRGWNRVSREDEILAVLSAPISSSAQAGFAEKETQLKSELAQLSPAESQQLASRLTKLHKDDAIATAVSRLTPERRARIVGFLADARKRSVIAKDNGGSSMLPAATSMTRDQGAPAAMSEAAAVLAVSAHQPLDTQLDHMIDEGKPELDVLMRFDGTERRALARRLETYRPGSGDSLGARFIRLDTTIRTMFLAALRAASPRSATATKTVDDVVAAPERAETAFGAYINIYATNLRDLIFAQMAGAAWPDPAPGLKWTSGSGNDFAVAISHFFVGKLASGASEIVRLLHPSDVVGLFHRKVPDLSHATWNAEFGFAFAGFAETAVLSSLKLRIGPAYRDVLARTSNAPSLAQLKAAEAYAIDELVAQALVVPGMVDLSEIPEVDSTNAATSPAAKSSHDRSGARVETRAPNRDELQQVDFAIGGLLDDIRARAAVNGDSSLSHAYADRAKRASVIATGDDNARASLVSKLQFQHTQLMTIAPKIVPLATQLVQAEAMLVASNTPDNRAERDRVRALLSKYLQAADLSYNEAESAALLRSISMDAAIEHDAAVQADVNSATEQVIQSTGHSVEHASQAEEEVARQRQTTIVNPAAQTKYDHARTETLAGEVALESRVRSVEHALVQLQAAADDAGFMDVKQFRKLVPDLAMTVPELIASVRAHLANVDVVWKQKTSEGTAKATHDKDAPADWASWEGRTAGLSAARDAFAKIAGDQGIGDFLRECSDRIRHERMVQAIAVVAATTLITMGVGFGAAALGRMASLALVGEAEGLVASGVAIAVRAPINAVAQYALSGGQGSLGWSMLENALMDTFTRGLTTKLRSAQAAALGEARALAALPNVGPAEARALATMSFTGTEVMVDLVAGMATQWAAHQIVTIASGRVEVDAAFEETVLQQGAAIALGRLLHTKYTAWKQHEAELVRSPLGSLPETKALIAAREQFYARAQQLAASVSPDPAEGLALQAEEQLLLKQERSLFEQHAEHSNAPNAQHSPADAPNPPAHDHASAPTTDEAHTASARASSTAEHAPLQHETKLPDDAERLKHAYAGLHSVVKDQVYEGTAEQIEHAFALADAAGLHVTRTQDAETGVWHVSIDGREIDLNVVHESPAITRKGHASDQTHGDGESHHQFDAMHPGPLSDRSTYDPDNKGNVLPAQGFYGGGYDPVVLKEDTVLYRVGNAEREWGEWFTDHPLESEAQYRIDVAVKPVWTDPRTGTMSEGSARSQKQMELWSYSILIPKGTTAYVGSVASQGGVFMGGVAEGQRQYFIPKAWLLGAKGGRVVAKAPFKSEGHVQPVPPTSSGDSSSGAK
ncbi:MAG TPA: hypothetical protein VH143_31290 [Kofleriaceae bacterium]|jgi:hypothetical protein|nr:hypothetical protein [Kofleriaceae bacterium]